MGIDDEVPVNDEQEYKVYKRRWLMLAIFSAYSGANNFQWIQYSIIANVVMDYYQVSLDLVNWLSMVFMIAYIPLIFPASWVLDKWGLRVTCIIGSAGTCLGAWIKVLSVGQDLFYVAFIGQTIAACAQAFVLSVPTRLAAVWFGPDQVSSACSIGVFGNQLGNALGFLFPPMLVKLHGDDVDKIGADFEVMNYIIAGVTTAIFLILIIAFRPAPPSPPSNTALSKDTDISFMGPIKNLLVNRGYILLLISYGINVGVFYAISTLLNQLILEYYPGREEDAGRIGLSIVISGLIGSVVGGVVLDKTHKFKEVTLALYILSLIGMLIYTFTLNVSDISVVYVTSCILGFFMTGYLPVGFEFAAELTYPEPEGTSSGLLSASAQVFGLAFTSMYSWLLTDYSGKVANITMCVALFIGTILTALVKSDLRRQKATPNDTLTPH